MTPKVEALPERGQGESELPADRVSQQARAGSMVRSTKYKRERFAAMKQLWWLLCAGELSPKRAALSLFVGVFIGCQPLYGLHLILCLAVCLPLRLHFALAYLAANISNPLVAPFLVALELQTGAWILHGKALSFELERVREVGAAGLLWQTAVGAQLVGLVLGALGAAIGFGVVRAVKGDPQPGAPDAALYRIGERYLKAPLEDRIYVTMKLRMDPLTRSLLTLTEPLGRVLDVGCGRGQFSLLLLELGLARSVTGFDWDERKVLAARAAAGASAEFSVADAAVFELPPSDTLLLFDVLHYLPHDQQDSLLRQAASSVGDTGQILIRELDRREGWLSSFGQTLERLVTRIGYNRARRLTFRPIAELTQVLATLGFECEALRGPRLPWSAANVLVVASRRPAPIG